METHAGAVVVVGVRVVVVHVHAGQHGAARRTAHGRRHEGVVEGGAAVAQDTPRLRHVVERTCDEKCQRDIRDRTTRCS